MDVGPGEGSLLIVPEAANAGWEATLDGHRLTPLPVDGWQQGWVLPGGSGGQVRLEFRPDRPYQLSLVLGGVCAFVLVALAAFTVRRRRDALAQPTAATVERPWHRVLVGAALLAGLCLVTGGLTCLAALCIGTAIGLRRRALVGVACWALPVAAALLVLVEQRNRALVLAQNGVTAQTLCLLAVGALAATLLLPADGQRHDAS